MYLLLTLFQAYNKSNSHTRLQDLNEYCLLEIFGSKTLDLMDLCALAETCKRFRRITKRLVPSVLGFEMGSNDKCRVNFGTYPHVTFKPYEVERIFKNFGSTLSTVSINSCSRSDCKFLISLLTQNHDDQLQCLTISHQEPFEMATVELKPIFTKLHTLHLHSVHMINDETLFAGMDSLVDLKVSWMSGDGAILKNTFPKLERFEYENDSILATNSIRSTFGQQSAELLVHFISRHNTWKRFKLLLHVSDKTSNTMILNAIGSSCSKLKILSFHCGQKTTVRDLQPLRQCTSLKHLDLWYVAFDNFNCISSMKRLKALRLFRCSVPEDYDQLHSLCEAIRVFIY